MSKEKPSDFFVYGRIPTSTILTLVFFQSYTI